MAEVATGLGIEQFPTAFGRVTDGVRVSRDEMIEGRIKEASVRSYAAMALSISCSFTALPKGLQEFSLVILVARDPRHSITDACRTHFEGVRDRQCRLLLKRGDPAVPKLMFVIEGIQNGWGVALADRPWMPTEAGLPSVKARCRIVACGAGDGAVPREPRLRRTASHPMRLW